MPDFFEVHIAEMYHSPLYHGPQQDRFKSGYVAVKNVGETNTLEIAKERVRDMIARFLQPGSAHITWEDENWTGKNGWKPVENSLTVL